MAKCRNFMRGLSIIVTVLLLVCGFFMTGVGFSSGYGNMLPPELGQWSTDHGVLLLRVFGPITVVLSVLGIVAATSDLKPLLLLLSALVFVEFAALMVVASPLVRLQTQMEDVQDGPFENVTLVDRINSHFQTDLNRLQAKEACCGLRGYSDWKEELPVSCLCAPPYHQPHSEAGNSTIDGSCVLVVADLRPVTSLMSSKETSSNETWVHSKPCGPILKRKMSLLFKLCIGVISAVATVMIAAIVLSLVFGLEGYWRAPLVETTVDDYNRVKYQPKPLLT